MARSLHARRDLSTAGRFSAGAGRTEEAAEKTEGLTYTYAKKKTHSADLPRFSPLSLSSKFK